MLSHQSTPLPLLSSQLQNSSAHPSNYPSHFHHEEVLLCYRTFEDEDGHGTASSSDEYLDEDDAEWQIFLKGTTEQPELYLVMDTISRSRAEDNIPLQKNN